MGLEHINDDRIQSYIDDRSSLNESEREHLQSCPECQKQLTEYKLLFGSISKIDEPELSVDFTASTMAQITAMAQPQAVKKFDWQTSLLVAFGAVCAVSVMIYLFGYKAILDKLQTFSFKKYLLENSTFTAFKDIFTQYGDLTTIVLFAALIIGFFITLDYLLKRFTSQKISLLSI